MDLKPMGATNISVPHRGLRHQEEINFQRLKTLIVDSMMIQKNVSESDMQNAVENIISSFRAGTFPELNLAPPAYACAYVHRFGALGMGLTRFKVLEALQNCGQLRRIFEKRDVNVVSLGGGPGIDVVGLTSALHERGIRSNLNVTVVDKEARWSPFINSLPVFIERGNFGNASNYFRVNEVSLSFMTAELPFDGANEAVQAMMEADVILMIRFMSSIEAKIWDDVIQSVLENMQDGAIALVIDGTFYREDWRKFELLYACQWDEYHYDVPPTDSDFRFGRGDANLSNCHLAVLRPYKNPYAEI